jgi:hypothetical protein
VRQLKIEEFSVIMPLYHSIPRAEVIAIAVSGSFLNNTGKPNNIQVVQRKEICGIISLSGYHFFAVAYN